MFRKPGKNPLDKDSPTPLYKDESKLVTPFKYGSKMSEHNDIPPRIFENSPHTRDERSWQEKERAPTHPFHAMIRDEEPETTLGEGVTFRGELSFERLLRIDGTFEGELLSEGMVIVGPKGKVKANLNLRQAIIEGTVEGNITVQERLELRGEACVRGDIKAKSLSVDDGVSVIGHVTVVAVESATSQS